MKEKRTKEEVKKIVLGELKNDLSGIVSTKFSVCEAKKMIEEGVNFVEETL